MGWPLTVSQILEAAIPALVQDTLTEATGTDFGGGEGRQQEADSHGFDVADSVSEATAFTCLANDKVDLASAGASAAPALEQLGSSSASGPVTAGFMKDWLAGSRLRPG